MPKPTEKTSLEQAARCADEIITLLRRCHADILIEAQEIIRAIDNDDGTIAADPQNLAIFRALISEVEWLGQVAARERKITASVQLGKRKF